MAKSFHSVSLCHLVQSDNIRFAQEWRARYKDDAVSLLDQSLFYERLFYFTHEVGLQDDIFARYESRHGAPIQGDPIQRLLRWSEGDDRDRRSQFRQEHGCE